MTLQTPHTSPPPVSLNYLQDSRWLDDHLAELVAQYPDKWVAVLKGQVVAVGDNRGEVVRKVVQNHPGSEPVIWLIEETVRVYTSHAQLS